MDFNFENSCGINKLPIDRVSSNSIQIFFLIQFSLSGVVLGKILV